MSSKQTVDVDSITAGTITATALPARTTNEPAQMIPLAELHESPLNPRQYYPEAGLNELAESMKASGFRAWLPIVGRPRAEGGVEIAAGHRRRKAAILAGLTEVPCVVREMSDAEFLDILNFDNSGREDVHPLHEAAGWSRWLLQDGRTVLDIAQRIGKSKEYVYKRLLVAEASEAVKKAFLDGEITLGHAEIIARCPARDQAKALQACQPPLFNPGASIMSTRSLKEWVDRNLNHDLALAPFSRTDADLVPEAGACGPCPNRLGNFVDFDEFEDSANACTDEGCYERKVTAWIEVEKARMEAEFGYLLLVSGERNPKDLHAVPWGEWHRLRAGELDAALKTALIVDGEERGKRVHVVIQAKLPIAPPEPAPAKAAKPAAPKADPKQLAEQKAARDRENERMRSEQRALARDREQQRMEREREGAVRKAILKAILATVAWPPSPASIAKVLEDWLDSSLPESLDDVVFTDGVEQVRARRDWGRVSPAQIARIVTIIDVADDFDEYSLGHGAAKLEAHAKAHAVDLKAVRKRAALEFTAESMDLRGDSITYMPTKGTEVEIKFIAEKGGTLVAYAVSLPVKGSDTFSESGEVIRIGTNPAERGTAIDAAFAAISKALAKVPGYASATEATREAAEEVKQWVTAGKAARAAQRELAALDAPVDSRKAAIANLPTVADRAKKSAAPAKKAPGKKAPAKKAAKKGGKK